MKDKNKFFFNFLNNHSLGVIATNGPDGFPEAAAIEFGQSSKLEIIFDTLITSRKYKNIKRSPKIAMVVGWDENQTVQLEGLAAELNDKERPGLKKAFFDKVPMAKKFEANQNIVYFKISLKWIRFTDLNKHPWEIFEVKF